MFLNTMLSILPEKIKNAVLQNAYFRHLTYPCRVGSLPPRPADLGHTVKKVYVIFLKNSIFVGGGGGTSVE
jgi:hypothetical protein